MTLGSQHDSEKSPPPEPKFGLRLVDVTKNYVGQAGAVRNVTMDVVQGEFFVLLGPSGCGKSTLLKLISGLDEPTSGEIYIRDRIVNYVEPGSRDVAMVFQNYALYPHMTVEQNIAFPLKMNKVKGKERETAASAAMRVVGIDESWRRRPVSQLSGGQRQRVAVARALVRRPTLTLMDEPLSNLDALLRLQTREQLLAMHKGMAGTIIYVTHDQVEAMTMGDRIGIMKDGELVQVGIPLEIYRNPVNTFVAGFLGSPPMNFLAAEALDGSSAAFTGKTLPPIRGLRLRRELEAHELLQIGIRPEAVRVEAATEPNSASWFVSLVEEFGAERILALTTHDRATEIRAKIMDERIWDVGQTVGVTISGSVTVFDSDGTSISDTTALRQRESSNVGR